MKPDDFENHLRQIPLRAPPAEWRDGILAAARTTARSARASEPGNRRPWWREWLWPTPWAWAGTAAVWALICALNAASTDPRTTLAAHSGPPLRAAELQLRLAELSLFQAELLGLAPNPERGPREPAVPGPRSQRRTSPFSA